MALPAGSGSRPDPPGPALGIETIVNKVLSTESMGAPPVTAHALSRVDDLTPPEVQVAQPAARGVSNRRIGETLVIAEKAANHLQNALDKLDVQSCTELAARAVGAGPRTGNVNLAFGRPVCWPFSTPTPFLRSHRDPASCAVVRADIDA